MNRYLDWLGQAQRDLKKAELDFQYEYWEWACFTAQQAAEKAVKSLLMYQGHDVWGRAITPMLRQLDSPSAPPELVENAQLLDAYYIPTRYPNGFAEGKPADYFNLSKAKEAVEAARAIVGYCENHIVGPDQPAD
jgi:HEPN domain-containing protein